MKKTVKRVSTLAFLIIILILPYFVFAKTTPLDGLEAIQGGSGYKEATQTSVSSIVGNIVSSLLGFLGLIFIISTIYGGYLWMTDQGNEEQVEKAKKIIKNSIVGLIIIMASYGIYSVLSLILAKNLN